MFKTRFTITCAVFVVLNLQALAATNDNFPKFEEVYKLLQENLKGVNAEQLNKAAVKGIVSQYDTRVLLGNASKAEEASMALKKAEILDGCIEYYQVCKVTEGLATRIATNHTQMIANGKNRLKGIILDLRFANGFDYAAAGAVVDLFLNSDQTLLTWENGSAKATTKTNAIDSHVAILVNSQTAGAAEAVAAALHESGAGLIIGSPTAGQASVFKEYTLSNGFQLRIASGQVRLGNDHALSNVKPDIAINVSIDEEKNYLKSPYISLSKAVNSTNLQTAQMEESLTNRVRRRFNEAELVRQQREGFDLDDDVAPQRADDNIRPSIADPVLLRGMDLLKALAVVQIKGKE